MIALARAVGDVLTSKLFWEVRILTCAVGIISVWIGVIMTADTIIYTPTEYLPALVIIGLVISVILVMVRARTAYNDTVKAKLRSGEIKEAPAFGLDYLSAYVGTIVIGVVGAFVFPGVIYEAIGAVPDYAGCLVIALVWSIIVGVKGATKASEIVDLFRDAAKIEALEAEAKKPKTE